MDSKGNSIADTFTLNVGQFASQTAAPSSQSSTSRPGVPGESRTQEHLEMSATNAELEKALREVEERREAEREVPAERRATNGELEKVLREVEERREGESEVQAETVIEVEEVEISAKAGREAENIPSPLVQQCGSLGGEVICAGETADDTHGSFLDGIAKTISAHLDLATRNTIDTYQDTVGQLALLLPTCKAEEAEEVMKSCHHITVQATAQTAYLKQSRTLWVLQYHSMHLAHPFPAAALQHFAELVTQTFSNLRSPEDGPFVWPVHHEDLSRTISLVEYNEVKVRCWRRALWALRILQPPQGTSLARSLKRHYGKEVGYVFSWANLFARNLWMLTLVCVIYYAAGVQADTFGRTSTGFYAMLCCTFVWATALATTSRATRLVMRSSETCEKIVQQEDEQDEAELDLYQHKGTRPNPDHIPVKRPALWALYAAIVTSLALLGLGVLAMVILFGFVQLRNLLIFEWGDCFGKDCITAEIKHGFLGTTSDIGADILLALSLEVALNEACKNVAFAVAKLWNFELMRHRLLLEAMLSLYIELFCKVGVFCLLALYFLPNWYEPVPYQRGQDLDFSAACSDLADFQLCSAVFNCDHALNPTCCSFTLSCAGKVLPFETRRELMDDMLKGAFVVAPFVDVVVQIVFALIAKLLHQAVDRAEGQAATNSAAALFKRWCCAGFAPILRLCSVLFVLDEGVTGFRYVCLGRTFSPPSEVPSDVAMAETSGKNGTRAEVDKKKIRKSVDQSRLMVPPMELCHAAINEAVLKEFDAIDELKDLKLCFLFVVFFAPLMPLGVPATLGARLLEIHLKLPKLFRGRRRCFPRDDRLVHQTQQGFGRILAVLAAFWYAGLVFISFNKELYTWPVHEVWLSFIGVGSAIALLSSAIIYFVGNHIGKAMIAAELAATAAIAEAQESGINMAERMTGLDLDGDGDIGEAGGMNEPASSGEGLS